MRRWLVFLAALAGSALFATGFALVVNRLAARDGQPPHLRTVSSATLAHDGYSLAPASVPPYCGVVQGAAVQGWVAGNTAGCPISREQAEAVAFPGGGRTVIETLLAQVTSADQAQVGRDREAWLVVVRYSSLLMPMYLCPVPAIGAPCPNVAPGFAATDVIVVDASSGQQLAVVRISSSGPVPPSRPQTVPAVSGAAVSPPPVPSPSATPR